MKARREKWHNRKADELEKQQLSEREITCGFELAPADLSSGGSDADCNDGYQSSSTSSLPSDEDKVVTSYSQAQKDKSRGRARKLRVTDSLDLSMSVATSSRSSRQAETMHSDRTKSQATHSKLLGKGPTYTCNGDSNQKSSNALLKNNPTCKPSRIPKLVQQRRQLQGLRAVASGGYLQAPMSAVGSNGPTTKWQHKTLTSGHCFSPPDASKKETLPHSTRSPIRDVPKRSSSISVKKEKTNNCDGDLEEIGSTTAEEQRLLQSLEKLDRRLSNVSNSAVSVREGGEQTSHNERSLKDDSIRARHATENHPSTVYATNENEIDVNTLRAAAYGGGTHCKIRQPSSVSVRSSSAKRAELSSGFHKSRVRVGGAFMNDTHQNSHTDGSGKHKIVVKKDLAHLLF
ncbi:hypothetical protein L915_01102 [Phytophthora nicotianae]|uniref:Uncharacterized protein n=1 Tax=Phytophthora nicotianae TaxID=4792 RepID=W2HLF0_PHYNI|nr:hypothetical protein L915_01102 [Phytophthora nicotianae]